MRSLFAVAMKPSDGLTECGFSLIDRKSTRLNSSHDQISYAVFCLKKKKKTYATFQYMVNSTQVTKAIFKDLLQDTQEDSVNGRDSLRLVAGGASRMTAEVMVPQT